MFRLCVRLWAWLRIGHGDSGRSDHPLTHPVAGLQDLNHGGALGALRQLSLNMHECLVNGRVERITWLTETLDADLAQRGIELVANSRQRPTPEPAIITRR